MYMCLYMCVYACECIYIYVSMWICIYKYTNKSPIFYLSIRLSAYICFSFSFFPVSQFLFPPIFSLCLSLSFSPSVSPYFFTLSSSQSLLFSHFLSLPPSFSPSLSVSLSYSLFSGRQYCVPIWEIFISNFSDKSVPVRSKISQYVIEIINLFHSHQLILYSHRRILFY